MNGDLLLAADARAGETVVESAGGLETTERQVTHLHQESQGGDFVRRVSAVSLLSTSP
jgi:hypothetical protein